MKIIIILVTIFLINFDLLAQRSPLFEKYQKMALEYNHDLKSAEKNINVAMELEKMARDNRKPNLAGSASFKYVGNPTTLELELSSPISFKGRNMQYGANAYLTQPLYTGGYLLESIKMAQLEQSLAKNEMEEMRTLICYQTDVQYLSTVARAEIVTITEEYKNSVETLTQKIKERVEMGVTDPQDLLMVEVKLNEAKYQLSQAQLDFETGVMALNSIIGLPLDKKIELEDKTSKVAINDALLTASVQNHYEVMAAMNVTKITQSQLKLNDSKYKPQLYIGADGSYSSPGYNFKKDLNLNYALYAKISIPIFEWGKRKSEKRISSQKIDIAFDKLNKVIDRVELEVKTSRTSLIQAIKQVELAESSLAKAQENELMAIEKYNEGRISIVEVISAQTYRQTSQMNYAQSKVAAQLYYSELIKVLQ